MLNPKSMIVISTAVYRPQMWVTIIIVLIVLNLNVTICFAVENVSKYFVSYLRISTCHQERLWSDGNEATSLSNVSDDHLRKLNIEIKAKRCQLVKQCVKLFAVEVTTNQEE